MLCVCECVCVYEYIHTHTHTHTEQVTLSNGVRHELKRTCYSLNSQHTAVERVQTATKSGM